MEAGKPIAAEPKSSKSAGRGSATRGFLLTPAKARPVPNITRHKKLAKQIFHS
jgi:hypothetical protein